MPKPYVLLLCAAMAACGQTGALYMPAPPPSPDAPADAAQEGQESDNEDREREQS